MTLLLRYILLTTLLFPSAIFAAKSDSLKVSEIEFTENKGQWENHLKFKADINSGSLWIEDNALTFDLFDPKAFINPSKNSNIHYLPKQINKHSYKIKFLNSNPECEIKGQDKKSYYFNYFIGNDKSKWVSNVNNYSYITYNNIYKNIDLSIYEKEGNLKWDFIVEPYTDVNSIKLKYIGVDRIKIKKGNLVITTSVNTITELKPIAYQKDANGDLIDIACQFSLINNILSFSFPNSYDKSKELIVDPTLVFATYSGSSTDNWGFTATYDESGFLYAGGIVFHSGYPVTPGAYQVSHDSLTDIAISKYDTTGSFLIYSTYLGGKFAEVPASLIVNSNDELIVLGTTASLNFPTTSSSYDTSFNGGSSVYISSTINFANGSDIFITKFNNTGSQLSASTFIGGSGNDGIMPNSVLLNNYGDDIRSEVVTDENNNIYIVSTTLSSNFPMIGNPFQPIKGTGSDGVIVKLDNSLSNIIWSSFFGGNAHDAIYGIKVSNNGEVYITGGTISTNLATTTNAYQTTYQGGTADGYIAEISPNGQNIQNCSYIGSSRYDQSYLLDLDRYNNVYLFGQTTDTSNSFIYNALWNSPKDGQFITKLNPTLSTRLWSTTWGNGVEGVDVVPSAFMVDLCNRVYLSAWGGSVNNSFGGGNTHNLPITSNAFQNTTDGSDYYLMVMNDDASALDYGSYYGGSSSHEHVDGGTSRFDNKGRIYQNVCAGCGGNSDFPTTPGCHSATNGSSYCNNGVFKMDFNIPAIVADYNTPPVVCLPDTTIFENTSFLSHPNSTTYIWDFDDGSSSSVTSPKHLYAQSGVYYVKLIISDPQSCNLSDTITKQVVVLSGAVNTLPTEYLCPGAIAQIGILPIQDTSVHFNWTPPTGLSDTSISNPYASPTFTTNYTMTATNGLCTDTLHQKVEILNLIAFAGNDTTICANSILLTGEGNYNNLNYLWSSNSTFSDTLNNYPNDSSLTYSLLNPTYLFFKIEKNGCSDYDSLLIEQRIIINQASITNPLCFNQASGSITINIQGNINPTNYLWNNGATTKNISNIAAGYYNLSITDADGCQATFDTTLTEPTELIIDTLSEGIPCDIACIGKAFANATGGTAPYTWLWDDASTQTTNPAIQLCEGKYHVIVTDANNCTANDSNIIINESASIDFKAWASKDTLYEGQVSDLFSTVIGGQIVYLWTPMDGLSDPTISNPQATPTSTTTYIVEAKDPFGCSWSDTITIYVNDVICDEPYIYVPNAFTPNNDGKNDFLKVESSVGYEVFFQVFDRWGELVFETEDINKSWDGIYNGKALEAGVYIYHLQLKCFNNQTFSKKGNITIIR